jgi:DNA-binding PadR family transcriptional regulator
MGRNHDGAPSSDDTRSTTTRRRRRPDEGIDGIDRWGGPSRGGRGRPPGGRGGPGGPGGRRGGGRRARRGDVRAAALALLLERPMHGYEMIGELSDRTNGIWTPSPGSVYPTLQMLEDEGLVTAEEVDGTRRYALTDTGREKAGEASGPAPWERFAGDAEEAALAAALDSLVPAVRQVHAVGTAEQQTRATELLVETRRKVYEILAAE